MNSVEILDNCSNLNIKYYGNLFVISNKVADKEPYFMIGPNCKFIRYLFHNF